MKIHNIKRSSKHILWAICGLPPSVIHLEYSRFRLVESFRAASNLITITAHLKKIRHDDFRQPKKCITVQLSEFPSRKTAPDLIIAEEYFDKRYSQTMQSFH